MIIGGPRPDVTAVIQQMPAYPPCRQLVRVTTLTRDILGSDSIRRELLQIRGVELHKPNIKCPVGVSHILAWLAVFYFGDSQNDIGQCFVFHSRSHRANNPFFEMWRQIGG